MTEQLKNTLIELASKYETPEFLQKDPSKYMHMYSQIEDMEAVAFIAANLAFGRRDQILKHIELILEKAGSSPSDWIKNKGYYDLFDDSSKSFYRMYSNKSMRLFFDTLNRILCTDKTLGSYFKSKWQASSQRKGFTHLTQIISKEFEADCNLIPHTDTSASKKLNMMLRWLVRDNSPVDIGLWKDWYDKKNLLIPLDTHVMQVSTDFGLIQRTKSGKIQGASIKTALSLTQIMKEVFPEDPVRGDFALFGFGVNSKPAND